jgi:hypothetical protein
MKLIWCITSLLIFLLVPLTQAWADANYQALKSGYENERGEMLKQYGERATALADQYLKSLQDLQKTLTEKGDASSALTVAAEIERFEKERRVYRDVSEATLLVLRNADEAKEMSQPAAVGGDKTAAISSERQTVATNLQQCAVGATVIASSTHSGEPGETNASALVDGDLTTRWSSDYAEPQNIVIQLKKPATLSKLRLHWENASAAKYCVYLSQDGKNWTSMYLYMSMGGGEPVARIDEVDLKNTLASWIKLDMQSRINKQWGFSLYEIEALGSESDGEAGRDHGLH